MAKNIDKTSSDSENSLCSSSSSPPMSNKYRYMFNRLFRFANSWKKSNSPRGRRIFHRDVEKEEFQYASSHCLSSYYSVFVVRLAIMVMLAILIGLLTILTWHFTKIYTKKSLSSLAYGLRYELLQRPILRMWNILNSTSEITTAQVKLSQYVIRRYSNPASQAEQVELYEAMRAVTWSLFASRKALNSITINYKNGFVQAFHRDLKDNNTFYIYSDLSNYSMVATTSNMLKSISTHQAWDDKTLHGNFSAIWYREPLDPVTGEKIGKAMKIAPEDLINIAGLSQVPDGVATWHVAVSKFTDSPLLSAALPVWDSSNKSIMAVVGVTTAFYSVGQLMRELVEMHSGHMYLTSQQGYLLATSTSAPLLTNSTKPPPKLKMAVDCEDEIIRLGAEWLQRTYGNHFPNSTHEVHVENAKLGNQQYYIDSFYLNLKRLPLVGVIIIPRKYIMGQVDERSFKTLVILISASLCIFVIGCVCILILTNGVSKEMNLRAELISQLEARRKAEASSNYKSQFLANMSHELRTPMAAVIGLLDILISDDCLTNEQYSTVTQIRKCSTALLRLLNNILDLSKVESGKLVLEDAEFDLGRELEGLVDMFSVQCINHNVETVLDLSDDMPKLVRGDSGRVVQVFANLINNSIKFTTSGHVILRGWCEYPNSCNDSPNFYLDQKKSRNLHKSKEKPNASHAKRISMRDNKVILWFEVEDTGCGIDPSKWDSVFESFEQADPSTTRLHGGTGLGLCIVRNLVNKMGGEIKVTKKEGQGTLMRLCLLLSAPVDVTEQHALNLTDNGLVVLLALQGNMGRIITSKWLTKKGVCTMEASEWNGLTQILRELFHARSSIHNSNNFDAHYPINLEGFKSKLLSIKDMRNPIFVIVVDIGLLDLSTDIWKEQLNFLHKYFGRAKFVWMLNHDTSNTIKTELRRKGHLLMVNKPLYKAKMIHILEAVIKERNHELQKKNMKEGDLHEFLEIDSTHFDAATSSDDSDISEISEKPIVKLTNENEHLEENNSRKEESCSSEEKKAKETNFATQGYDRVTRTRKEVNDKKSLEGLRILLAEDTPVIQRVATIMLEKMGAVVVAVGDGQQAVDALNYMASAEDCRRESLQKDRNTRSQTEILTCHQYDLILMDCQMPKMDGYEATKEIRKSEEGTGKHIPIVALTAHAMSCDEAKCLKVGMDAYLTKPIDFKLMVSTILSLTKPTN
ncbi:putative histidine kinase response regulator and transcription factor RR-A-type family [Medicago truncatula]|uniref:histidine kinase n=2 Tax=Trifolieae TaxID=163742 RepID=G7JXI9_MEDTR|nr:histidine kinase 1 [Medicago truncatula]AES95160.2 osmosensor histidine kinase [Medicago truncatula]RHN54346.1 putative histidine kinase response regulator and transcription factor RR-A-type family [Medicago truncatula]